MKKNIGTYDALIRITFGLVGLAYCIARANRRKYNFPWIIASVFAMKVGEGILRYCPMLDLLGRNTTGQDNKNSLSITNETTK